MRMGSRDMNVNTVYAFVNHHSARCSQVLPQCAGTCSQVRSQRVRAGPQEGNAAQN
jgi:hypothetical protein